MQIRVVGALNLSQLKGFPAVGQTHIACEFTKKNRYLASCSYFEIKTGMRFMHKIPKISTMISILEKLTANHKDPSNW